VLSQHVGSVAGREKSTGPDVELIGVVKLSGRIQDLDGVVAGGRTSFVLRIEQYWLGRLHLRSPSGEISAQADVARRPKADPARAASHAPQAARRARLVHPCVTWYQNSAPRNLGSHVTLPNRRLVSSSAGNLEDDGSARVRVN
jgi:hypothetical protein